MSTATCEPLVQERDAAEHTSSMQLVSFKLGDETYGIEITKIREIILVGEITQIPETPSYVKGLINLRSAVIPVIDLRTRFSLADAELTPERGSWCSTWGGARSGSSSIRSTRC
jgi:purine-binding chemotaxis protein CheW